MFKRKRSAPVEVRRTCKRCGTEWFAPKGGSVFTRRMSFSEALATGLSNTATAMKANEVAADKRCPSCGSQAYDEVDAPVTS